MTINWLVVGIATGIGAVLGVIGDWQIGMRLRKRTGRRALAKEYASLAGHYTSYRMRENGVLEPTGETVKIKWEPRDSIMKISGLRPNGDTEWLSDIRMSMEIKGTGAGHYHHVDSIYSGVQLVTYSKGTQLFNVMGTDSARKQFNQVWTLKG